MDLVEFYYSNTVGCYPGEDNDFRDKTKKVVDYLEDAGVSNEKILRFLEEAPAANYLTTDMLSDWIWEDSILKREAFYYHNTLQITSKAPSFSPITGKETVYPFYLEMKINYSMNDLINYCYRKLGLDPVFLDYKKDAGSFNFLLKRYESLSFIEPVDFILSLVDYTKDMEDEQSINSVLDIRRYEQEVNKVLQSKVLNAAKAGANRIVWR